MFLWDIHTTIHQTSCGSNYRCGYVMPGWTYFYDFGTNLKDSAAMPQFMEVASIAFPSRAACTTVPWIAAAPTMQTPPLTAKALCRVPIDLMSTVKSVALLLMASPFLCRRDHGSLGNRLTTFRELFRRLDQAHFNHGLTVDCFKLSLKCGFHFDFMEFGPF